MSRLCFVLDANAMARRFFDDIGKRNIDAIFNRTNSTYIVPDICIVETCSALLASYNEGIITDIDYQSAKSALFNMIDKGEINVVTIYDYTKDSISLLEKYKSQPSKGFNGVDAIYILCSKKIADNLANTVAKVIFVTSDNKLYNAAKDESSFESFHFWTCDLGGCTCAPFIPKKNDSDRNAEYKTCDSCGNNIMIKTSYTSPNSCPHCKKHCSDCQYYSCPSSYTHKF